MDEREELRQLMASTWSMVQEAQAQLQDMEERIQSSMQLNGEARLQVQLTRPRNRQDWVSQQLPVQAEQLRQTQLALHQLKANPALVGMFLNDDDTLG
ncbi:hypothetical protein [Deinococcus sonorensis]|uniref:Uncharacterized protein n=2 Tax=Deinococcus sonorensis TaxID=309891 RepID=A0AAU7U764_9DEIO